MPHSSVDKYLMLDKFVSTFIHTVFFNGYLVVASTTIYCNLEHLYKLFSICINILMANRTQFLKCVALTKTWPIFLNGQFV